MGATNAHTSSSNRTLAEVVRSYANFRVPWITEPARAVPPTPEPSLADQATGGSPLLPATDDDRPESTSRRLTRADVDRAVKLYDGGASLCAIARELSISWDSVARLLNGAGRRSHSRRGPVHLRDRGTARGGSDQRT